MMGRGCTMLTAMALLTSLLLITALWNILWNKFSHRMTTGRHLQSDRLIFPTSNGSRADTSLNLGIVKESIPLKIDAQNPSISSVHMNQLTERSDISDLTSKQTQNTVAPALNQSNRMRKQHLYTPAGKVVGFFNIFSGKETILIEKIIHEEITMFESTKIIDSIESISFVIFGAKHSTLQMPPGAKYIRSNASRETGDEQDTLELLHSHCHAHSDDRVFYIHSKGSFHPSEANDRLRRNLIKAVLHCIRNQTMGNSDICGLRFAPIPYPHLSGNMWYARCAYISKLAPPREYAARLLTLAAKPSCLDWMLGINRAAQEHWATSHPSVVVQDVLPYHTVLGTPINYRWSIFDVPDPASWEPDPRLFPRPGMTVERFLLPYFLPHLGCSAVSYREQQYVAVFGRAATERSACEGFRRTWPSVARGAFNASGGPLSLPVRTYLDDIDRHSAALRAAAQPCA